MEPERADVLRLYYHMRLTRALDERLRALFAQGHITGGVATARGYEATSVGSALALEPGDVVAPERHDLGVLVARGMTPREILSQWLARAPAASGGRDGQTHWGDMRERLVLPSVGLPGVGLPVAMGAALGARLRGERRVVAAYCDAAACDLGSFHEAMTCAVALGLPFILIVEHAVPAAMDSTVALSRARLLADRAAAYGVASATVDGNDPLEVYEATRQAAAASREGRGPRIITATVTRAIARPNGSDDADPLDNWRRDPVERFTRALTNSGDLSADMILRYVTEIAALLDQAVADALAEPLPAPDEAPGAVFAPADAEPMGPRALTTPESAPVAAPELLPIAATSLPGEGAKSDGTSA